MPRPVLAYVTILTAIATGLLIWYGNQVHRSDWPYLVLLVPVIVLTGLYYVKTQTQPSITFSFEAAMKVMALLVAGLPTALWTAAIGTLATGLVRGNPGSKLAYNMSQSVISLFVAGMVFYALGGQSGPGFNHPFAALLAAALYLFLNATFLSQLFALLNSGSGGWLTVFRQVLPVQTFVTFMVGQIAGIIGASYLAQGSGIWLVMIVLLLVLFQLAFQRYLLLLDNATLRGKELEAMLNSTKNAIVVTDRSGAVRHVNAPFLTLVRETGSPNDLVGRDLSDVARFAIGGRVLQHAQAAVARLQAGRPTPAGDDTAGVETVLNVPGAGPWRWLNYYRGPVQGITSPDEGVIHVFSDITAVKETEERLRSLHESVLAALTFLIDARDPYTHGHSARVAEMASAVARQLGLSVEDCQRIRYAGLLHDIGKVGVDDSVLRKHGPLSVEERARIMEHPVIGAQLLERAGVFTELLPGVRHHHEWFGGGGYPDGLRGEDIPLDARILGVVDAFDAMTSDRPYRIALTDAEALDRLNAGTGSQFDPVAVAAFLSIYGEGAVQAARTHGVGTEPQTLGTLVEAKPPAAAGGVIRPEHKRELSILYELSRENYARLNLHAVLRRFLEIFCDRVGPHVYGVYLQDPDADELVLQASFGAADLALPPTWRHGRGLVGKVAETGRLVVSTEWLPESQQGSAAGAGPACAVPLPHSGRMVGVLLVQCAVSTGFDTEELYLLEALGPHLASAIELARYHQQLAHAATHDGLTDIHNHSYFYDRLNEEILRGKRYREPLSVVIIDIDQLKQINDTHGHLVGDEVLRQWALLLRDHLRQTDIVARYGGDEFGIIMPETSRSQAVAVLERILQAAASRRLPQAPDLNLPSGSFGIACFPEDGDRATDLVAGADARMYARKGQHRPADVSRGS